MASTKSQDALLHLNFEWIRVGLCGVEYEEKDHPLSTDATSLLLECTPIYRPAFILAIHFLLLLYVGELKHHAQLRSKLCEGEHQPGHPAASSQYHVPSVHSPQSHWSGFRGQSAIDQGLTIRSTVSDTFIAASLHRYVLCVCVGF
jgi:hypothetical protein